MKIRLIANKSEELGVRAVGKKTRDCQSIGRSSKSKSSYAGKLEFTLQR